MRNFMDVKGWRKKHGEKKKKRFPCHVPKTDFGLHPSEAEVKLQQCLFACVVVTVNYVEVRLMKTNNANCTSCVGVLISASLDRDVEHEAEKDDRESERWVS